MTDEVNSHSTTALEIFKGKGRLEGIFSDLALSLERNPQIFTQPISQELQNQIAFLAGMMHRDILRGQDFMAESYLNGDAYLWLDDHSQVRKLGMQAGFSKSGRLGAVIAMHPNRDEIVPFITEDFTNHPYGLKVLPHVSRLLTHENAPDCYNFAIEILKHPESYEGIPNSQDGSGAFIYWTYGPYLLSNLKQKGLQYSDMIKMWSSKREKSKEFHGGARYPGINYMYEGHNPPFHYLAKDGQDDSHKFVQFIIEKAIIPNIL
jgi:hypothetical protein